MRVMFTKQVSSRHPKTTEHFQWAGSYGYMVAKNQCTHQKTATLSFGTVTVTQCRKCNKVLSAQDPIKAKIQPVYIGIYLDPSLDEDYFPIIRNYCQSCPTNAYFVTFEAQDKTTLLEQAAGFAVKTWIDRLPKEDGLLGNYIRNSKFLTHCDQATIFTRYEPKALPPELKDLVSKLLNRHKLHKFISLDRDNPVVDFAELEPFRNLIPTEEAWARKFTTKQLANWRWPFGKHQGSALKDVPILYLDSMSTREWCSGKLRLVAQEWIRRNQEAFKAAIVEAEALEVLIAEATEDQDETLLSELQVRHQLLTGSEFHTFLSGSDIETISANSQNRGDVGLTDFNDRDDTDLEGWNEAFIPTEQVEDETAPRLQAKASPSNKANPSVFRPTTEDLYGLQWQDIPKYAYERLHITEKDLA